MPLAWALNALALLLGAGLGVRALIDPHWAAKFVRLTPDEQGGGFAEFRATYGGEYVIGVAATGAAAALAAAWAGACGGRLIAMWRDGARTRFNTMSAGVEAAMALAIGAPWLVWILSSSR